MNFVCNLGRSEAVGLSREFYLLQALDISQLESDSGTDLPLSHRNGVYTLSKLFPKHRSNKSMPAMSSAAGSKNAIRDDNCEQFNLLKSSRCLWNAAFERPRFRPN